MPNPDRPAPRRDALLLVILVGVVFLLTGSHPALGSSTRYAESCREMVELGDWIVPHLAYVPYFEKPILTYWLGALSQLVFGGGHLATNLPAALAAAVSVVATWALARRLGDRAFAFGAAIALLGGGLFLSFVSSLTTDPILAACLAVVWWGFWCFEEDRSGRGIWAFWAALGLGVLAKGPIAIVLSGAAIGGYALLAHGPLGVFRTLWAMHPLRGLAIIALINLPWSWAVWRRDPRFLEFFYVRINFQAFFDGSVNHPGPWWYYGPVLLGYLAPTALVSGPALVTALWNHLGFRWSAPSGGDIRLRLFLACVIAFPLAFLSISASKLGTYPLPLMPAVAILSWEVLCRWDAGGRALPRIALAGFAALILVALAVAPWVIVATQHVDAIGIGRLVVNAQQFQQLAYVDWTTIPIALLGLAVLVVGLISTMWCCARMRLTQAVLVLLGTFAVLVSVVLPRIDSIIPDIDSKRLISVIRQADGPQATIILHQDVVHDYELVHALGRRTLIVGNARELGMGHFAEKTPPSIPFPGKGQPIDDPYWVSGNTFPDNPWLLSTDALKMQWQGSRRIWMLCEESSARWASGLGLAVHVIDRAQAVVLISNRP